MPRVTSSRRIADGAKFHHLREAYFDFIWDTESALKRETPIFSWSPNSFVVSNQCLRYRWSASHSQSEALVSEGTGRFFILFCSVKVCCDVEAGETFLLEKEICRGFALQPLWWECPKQCQTVGGAHTREYHVGELVMFPW